MPDSALRALPLEIHHEISSYLTRVEYIVLGLTCKSLNAIYALPAFNATPPRKFWTMFSTDDFYSQKELLREWKARHLILPLLGDWVERVMREARLRDRDSTTADGQTGWKICTGCARFKVYSDDWEEGYLFQIVMEYDHLIDEWDGEDQETLERLILDGEFCASCSWNWEKLSTGEICRRTGGFGKVEG